MKNLGNEGLKDLSKIEFNELLKIDLSNNKISDIKVLKNVNFKELKILYLNRNKISDIKV